MAFLWQRAKRIFRGRYRLRPRQIRTAQWTFGHRSASLDTDVFFPAAWPQAPVVLDPCLCVSLCPTWMGDWEARLPGHLVFAPFAPRTSLQLLALVVVHPIIAFVFGPAAMVNSPQAKSLQHRQVVGYKGHSHRCQVVATRQVVGTGWRGGVVRAAVGWGL